MNKRILSILLCLMLVMSLLVLAVPANAAAAASVTLTADKTEAKPGDTVTFTLTLAPMDDIGSVEFVIEPNGWTLDSVSTTDGLAAKLGILLADVNNADGTVKFTSMAGMSAGHTETDVVLGTFTAKINDDATGTLTFDVVDEAGANYGNNYDGDDVGFNFTPATVTVSAESTEPAPTEPAPTEPAPTEPAPTEPAPTEPAPTEPAPTEPAPTEPAHVHDLRFVAEVPATYEADGVAAHWVCDGCGKMFSDNTGAVEVTAEDLVLPKLTPTEPAPTEPAPTEPAPTEPAPTEPAPTEPAPTEPAPTEPAPTEAAPTEAAPTEAAPTEAAPTEAAPTEPAPTSATSTYAFENSSYKYDHGDVEIILAGFNMYVHNTDTTLDKDTVSHFQKIVINGVDVTADFEKDDTVTEGLRISIGRTYAEKFFHNGDNTVEVYFDDAASPATTTVQAVNLPEEPTEVTPADDKGATGDQATGDQATKDYSNATKDSSSSSSPKTGDSTHMYLWMLIMLASLAGVVAVLYTAKRKGIFTK